VGVKVPRKKETGNERRSDVLRHDLITLLEGIEDEEALAFLLRQARTIIHNISVQKVNDEIQRLGHEAVALSTEPLRRKQKAPAPARVEANPGAKSFVLEAGGQRKILSLTEMKELARICQAAPNPEEGAARLYRWLTRNRTDILGDAGIRSWQDTVLQEIFKEIRDNFRARKG
jgi:hypothetical protein